MRKVPGRGGDQPLLVVAVLVKNPGPEDRDFNPRINMATRLEHKNLLNEQGEGIDFMKLNNLDNRFLLLLAKEWKETGIDGPYQTSLIYKGYSDLSDEYITSQLKKFNTEGLITFTSDKHKLYLTDKGFSQIESLISIDRWNSIGI